MRTNTRLYSVLNCTVHVSVCRRFVCQRFWSVDVLICRRFGSVWFVDVLVCRRFGLSTFRSVDALVCWCFGMSTFWFVDALVCRRFGLSTFRYPSVSVCRRFGCRRFGFSTFWPATYKRVHFDTPNPFCEARRASHCHSAQTTYSSKSTCCAISAQNSAMHIVVYAGRLTSQRSIFEIINW